MTLLTQLGGMAAALLLLDVGGTEGVWPLFFRAHAADFGSYFLLLALMLAMYSFLAGGLALFGRDHLSEKIGETARRAGIAIFFLVILAAIVLVAAAFQDNFSIAYILQHSNRDLPIAYKFAVLWSGQEGSVLFWTLLLSTYGLVLRLRHKTDTRLFAHASVIIAGVQIFFLLLVNFAARPFALTQGGIPADGNGLNPLLQYPEMVIHPPMLYLGYVGFTVPFAFGLGALIMRYPGEKWIHITRRWTMVAWAFLSVGISLGSHWAYNVLGWGGYWGWDPVENAAFMPWLSGLAFLHSVMMQEKRGMLKIWNVWLVFSTFLLSILGTFLTRSGVISSVHAFAQSSIGTWFLVFLGIALGTCGVVFYMNRSHLQSEHRLEAVVSREASFLFNNMILLVACFTVLWGTFFPVISQAIQDVKVTVGPPFYNKVMIPIALLLLLLTAVGPLLSWRKTSVDSLRRNFLWPAVGAVALGLGLMIWGVRPWQDWAVFYALTAIALSALVIFTISSEFGRGGRVISRHTGQNLLLSISQLGRRNTRRYGGYIAHVGFAVILIGVAGSAFNRDAEKEMSYGDKLQIKNYELVCRSYTQDDKPNYASEWAILDVFQNGKQIDTLFPERRFYKASQQTSTMVAKRSTLKEDLYVVYEGLNQDTGRPIIKVHVNPLVNWIWIGVLMLLFGIFMAMLPNTLPAAVTVPARVQPATVGAGD
jgi:cytochrome c-type biogenesis protein CcmF